MKSFARVMIIAIAIVTWGIGTGWAAESGEHGLSGEFLGYAVGGRAAGMGGAMTGLADDASAVFYNPAGLALQNPISVSGQHVALFSDTWLDYVALSFPIKGVGHIGLGGLWLTSDKFNLRDEKYQVLNLPCTVQQGAMQLSYAFDVTPRLLVGVTGKVAHETIFSRADTGMGVDVGMMYLFLPEIQIGGMIENVVQPAVLGEAYARSVSLALGARLFDGGLLLDAEVKKRITNQSPQWKIGAEVGLWDRQIMLRAGMDDEMRTAVGVGGRLMNIQVDYAATLEDLGLVHKMSLSYAFGGYEVRIIARPKIFSPTGIHRQVVLSAQAMTKYEIDEWVLEIRDPNGELVWSVTGAGVLPAEVTWNGKDDRGLVCGDGQYQAQLIMVDEHGKTLRSNREVFVMQSGTPLADELDFK